MVPRSEMALNIVMAMITWMTTTCAWKLLGRRRRRRPPQQGSRNEHLFQLVTVGTVQYFTYCCWRSRPVVILVLLLLRVSMLTFPLLFWRNLPVSSFVLSSFSLSSSMTRSVSNLLHSTVVILLQYSTVLYSYFFKLFIAWRRVTSSFSDKKLGFSLKN
jgi:hypothetical protein